MVSVTLSIPIQVRAIMKKHDEVNWSGFIRKAIEQKSTELEKIESFEKKLEKDQEIVEWSVKLQRASRSGRLDSLKKKGLL